MSLLELPKPKDLVPREKQGILLQLQMKMHTTLETSFYSGIDRRVNNLLTQQPTSSTQTPDLRAPLVVDHGPSPLHSSFSAAFSSTPTSATRP